MPNKNRKLKAVLSAACRPRLLRLLEYVWTVSFGLRVSAVLLLAAPGCVSKQAAQERSRQAYEAGFKQGQSAEQLKRTHVFFRGPVRQTTLRWREGLTLAKAIVEAVYDSPNDPAVINLTRGGRVIPIDPAELFRGIDPPLEAGDLIELR